MHWFKQSLNDGSVITDTCHVYYKNLFKKIKNKKNTFYLIIITFFLLTGMLKVIIFKNELTFIKIQKYSIYLYYGKIENVMSLKDYSFKFKPR